MTDSDMSFEHGTLTAATTDRLSTTVVDGDPESVGVYKLDETRVAVRLPIELALEEAKHEQ